MRNTKIKPETLFDFTDEDTDVVIVDKLPDFDAEEATQPMAHLSMAELVGMSPSGPDKPTRDLKVSTASDGVPIPVEHERTQPYRHAYAGRVALQLGGLQ